MLLNVNVNSGPNFVTRFLPYLSISLPLFAAEFVELARSNFCVYVYVCVAPYPLSSASAATYTLGHA